MRSNKFYVVQTAENAENAESADYDFGVGQKQGIGFSPLIPDDVFGKLPSIMKKSTEVFKDKRERDVFLTGALTTLSGCFPGVSGVYDKKMNFPPIYSFVVAPPGSGKASLEWAKTLVAKVHARIRKSKKNIVKTKKRYDELGKTPNLKFRTLFIPGNASAAVITQHLIESDGNGIIFETEADSLSNSLGQDWGNFSDSLRKAFHNEPISLSRKGDGGQYIEILKPKLAVAMSGTPGQVRPLIPSSENGLLSRFLFYAFEQDLVWKDVAPTEVTSDLDSVFDELSEEVLEIVDFTATNPFRFKLSVLQWKDLNDFFDSHLKKVGIDYPKESGGTILRMGCITFRIAMLLTILKRFDEQNVHPEVQCDDEIFQISLKLARTYISHGVGIYSLLPRKQYLKNNRVKDLYDSLPNGAFTTRDLHQIGEKINIPHRTCMEYANKLIEKNLLKKIKHGEYEKT